MTSALLAALALSAAPAPAAPGPLAAETVLEPLGVALENFTYPNPVRHLPISVEGQDLRMAYMDVAPSGASNGRTVVLLHGKNFPGAYWADAVRALAAPGFRVVVPDQIGFGKSSKPNVHYTFELLARCTKRLLEDLGVARAAQVPVIEHVESGGAIGMYRVDVGPRLEGFDHEGGIHSAAAHYSDDSYV